jgi:hypothetical protein
MLMKNELLVVGGSINNVSQNIPIIISLKSFAYDSIVAS